MAQTVTKTITDIVVDLLNQNPKGLCYSDLVNKIQETDQSFKINTIHGVLVKLVATNPEKVYKPAKGLFRLLAFQDQDDDPIHTVPSQTKKGDKSREEDFYEPFANWLKDEIEDVSHVKVLGGKVFQDKWCTPDVIGILESGRNDVIKRPMEIVSAEIKTDPNHLITAFGQSCTYKLFSHKVYIVVPKQADPVDIDKLDSLCQILGIGLVTFDDQSPAAPDFRIRVRPSKHEPDWFYTNKYLTRIAF